MYLHVFHWPELRKKITLTHSRLPALTDHRVISNSTIRLVNLLLHLHGTFMSRSVWPYCSVLFSYSLPSLPPTIKVRTMMKVMKTKKTVMTGKRVTMMAMMARLKSCSGDGSQHLLWPTPTDHGTATGFHYRSKDSEGGICCKTCSKPFIEAIIMYWNPLSWVFQSKLCWQQLVSDNEKK